MIFAQAFCVHETPIKIYWSPQGQGRFGFFTVFCFWQQRKHARLFLFDVFFNDLLYQSTYSFRKRVPQMPFWLHGETVKPLILVSSESQKKTWLVGLYRGLYHPVIWAFG